ncbi:MAG: PilZ domain-containing protein, partial [Bdellovibrionaceae bacterium]|nr:PilZ domain-containing protein [Pseudobdellovibrionaceae bacterium]
MAFNSFTFKMPFSNVNLKTNSGGDFEQPEPPEGVILKEKKTKDRNTVASKIQGTSGSSAPSQKQFSSNHLGMTEKTVPTGHFEKRSAPRYPFHFDVVIMGQKRSVRTYSENISESGILVADLLPIEFNKENLEILVIVKDEQGRSEYFLFHGRTIDSVIRSKRIQFVRTVANSKEKLVQLFEKL